MDRSKKMTALTLPSTNTMVKQIGWCGTDYIRALSGWPYPVASLGQASWASCLPCPKNLMDVWWMGSYKCWPVCRVLCMCLSSSSSTGRHLEESTPSVLIALAGHIESLEQNGGTRESGRKIYFLTICTDSNPCCYPSLHPHNAFMYVYVHQKVTWLPPLPFWQHRGLNNNKKNNGMRVHLHRLEHVSAHTS